MSSSLSPLVKNDDDGNYHYGEKHNDYNDDNNWDKNIALITTQQ